MELTRRDAVTALVAIGATGGAALAATRLRSGAIDGRSPENELGDDVQVRRTMQAVAPVVFPDGIDGIAPFVDGFLDGRLSRPAHAQALRETVAELNALAESWHGDRMFDLPSHRRDTVLREVGADAADEDPTGTTAERVRYYVVNELLLALYASPKGGSLVGIENPQGHPGGIESYTQPP